MFRCIHPISEIYRGIFRLKAHAMFRTAPRTLKTIVKPDSSNIEEEVKKMERIFNKEWEDFKKKFNKSYASAEEEFKRRQIFMETYHWVEQHNKEFGIITDKVIVNNLADRTPAEKKKLCGRVIP